jgi:hypothetical protein
MSPAPSISRVIDGAGDIDGRFRGVTADTDSWSVTSDGDTKTVNNGGGDDAFPILKIKPTAAKTGYSYTRWCPVRWNLHESIFYYPVDIANASLDTAALISSKMQADGDDLRVHVDGAEVERWIGGLNTSTSRVWVRLDFKEKGELPLLTAISSGGGVTEIAFDTAYRDELLNKFPNAGIVMIGSEAFSYTGKDYYGAKLTGVTRAVRGTSAAAHSAAATVWWVQHDIWMIYGNASVSDPVQSDRRKPMLRLDTSTNTSWVFANFGESPHRYSHGDWFMYPLSNLKGVAYYGNRGAYTNPHEEMGLKLDVDAYSGFDWPRFTARWHLFNPCGITNANFTNGEKYADRLGIWVGGIDKTEKFSYSEWVEEASITAPTIASTWQTWSQNEAFANFVDDAGVTRYPLGVGMRLQVDWDGTAFLAQMEVSDVTLTLDSNLTPGATLGSEISSGVYVVEATITNETTGDAISIYFVHSVDDELEIDTDLKTVTYLTDNSNQFSALTLEGAIRRDWLPLVPGNNTLRWDETGAGSLTVALEWKERTYE